MSLQGGLAQDRQTSLAKPIQISRVRVWDGPTRLMHWLLVFFIAVCWWTGIHNQLEYHLYSGYGALWVVLLRLYWGFFGSSTARFANFVRGPRTVFSYMCTLHKRNATHIHGHNPLGALSVLVMLALVLAVIVPGLFAVDVDGLYSGPLSSYVSFHSGRHLAHLHYRIFNGLLAVIVLHLIAVGFYYIYKGQNLVFPMISGTRKSDVGAGGELEIAPLWRLFLGSIVAAGVVWIISTGFYL